MMCGCIFKLGLHQNLPSRITSEMLPFINFSMKSSNYSATGQWGKPFVTVGAFLGVTTGVFGSVLDSIGDYYACARISGAPKPPNHAVNRGIVLEGLSCILAGAWGTGIGVASYSECVGNIGLTKVCMNLLYTCSLQVSSIGRI